MAATQPAPGLKVDGVWAVDGELAFPWEREGGELAFPCEREGARVAELAASQPLRAGRRRQSQK
jgi:hypothetical protein